MAKPPSNELDTWDLGKLSAEIYLVKREVRPAANMILRKSLLQRAKRMVSDEGLRFHITTLNESHVSFSVFLHPHLETIIPQIDALPFPLRDWANGKLFGYSEAQIGDFLAAKTEVEP